MNLKLKDLLNESATSKQLEDAKEMIYSHMDDDNFPEKAGKNKISKYVYNQFTKKGTMFFTTSMRSVAFTKSQIEKLIKDITEDLQYGEGQHP